MCKVTYDQDVDCMYVTLIEDSSDRNIKTKSIKEHIHIDIDADTGEIVGIEFVAIEEIKRKAEQI